MLPVTVLVVALLGGAAAAVAGFGIGSLLTPVLALRVGTPAAVTAVAFPHFAATALRCWRLRHEIDRDLLRRFGILSAAGSLGGALLGGALGAARLTLVLGALLILTGVSALLGAVASWNIPRPLTWILGLVSGLFGGLVGNQGGVRAVALLPFQLRPPAFVATATATALLVDIARTPVYLWRGGQSLPTLWPWIGVALVGVLAGTLLGERILLGLTPARFRQLVGGVVLVAGLTVLAGAW